MIGAIDVDYRDDVTVVALVLLSSWTAPKPADILIYFDDEPPSEYTSGEFYRRELPFLRRALAERPALETVLVDGYVWLGCDRPGLGKYLYDAIHTPVVGIAKSYFRGSEAVARPVARGSSRRPIYVTAEGLPLAEAAQRVENLPGAHRLPDVVSAANRISRIASLTG